MANNPGLVVKAKGRKKIKTMASTSWGTKETTLD